MVKNFAGPMHGTEALVKVGVTIIVAMTGVVPALTAEKEAISPDPEAASPIPGVSLVQANDVVPPVLEVVKLTAVVALALHST